MELRGQPRAAMEDRGRTRLAPRNADPFGDPQDRSSYIDPAAPYANPFGEIDPHGPLDATFEWQAAPAWRSRTPLVRRWSPPEGRLNIPEHFAIERYQGLNAIGASRGTRRRLRQLMLAEQR